MDRDEIKAIRVLAKEYDAVIGDIEYCAFREFKVRWTMTEGHHFEFQLSDYLKDAPNGMTLSLFRTLLDRIFGKSLGYEDKFKDYIKSSDFIDSNAPIWERRCHVSVPEKENIDIRTLAKNCGFDGDVKWMRGSLVAKPIVVSAIFRTMYISEEYNNDYDINNLKRLIDNYVETYNEAVSKFLVTPGE